MSFQFTDSKDVSMKAAIYDKAGPADVLRYADVSDPVCKVGEVLIRVEAIAVEGGDVLSRGTIDPPAPAYIGGYAAAGTIIEVGSDDLGWSVGDRVATIGIGGSHADLRAVPAQACYRVPEGLDMARAVAVPVPFLTASHSLFRVARLQPGETLLIQGAAGSVGLAAIQLAASNEAYVIAVQAGSERVARLRELGANMVIDRKVDDVVEAVRRGTDGHMASVVLDPVGGATLDSSIAATQAFGRILLIGNASRVPMRPDLRPTIAENISLFGVSLRAGFAAPESKEDIEKILEKVAKGELEVLLDKRFPLKDAAAAHKYIEDNQILGRVILEP
ncbi:quinone oxidoreductase family protein [Acidocella sp.]|uniref:quinone oxidoreductase family protein n=1 Tax=Acidocella sp. TaxID=50710 RepID=UPI003D054C16